MRRAVSAHSPYRTLIAPALRSPWSRVLYAPTPARRYIHCPTLPNQVANPVPRKHHDESAASQQRSYDNHAVLPKHYDLAWIKDVLRIECVLNGAHGAKRALTVLRRQIFHLALADAVFARAGAVHG
jgi:hypothetical protein